MKDERDITNENHVLYVERNSHLKTHFSLLKEGKVRGVGGRKKVSRQEGGREGRKVWGFFVSSF